MSKIVMLFFIALLVLSVAPAQAKPKQSKLSAARCRAEILSLKGKAPGYFERLPDKQLRYLYDLAGDCGDTTVAGLMRDELNNIDEVYSTIDKLFSAKPVERQKVITDVNVADPSHCRTHLNMLRAIDWNLLWPSTTLQQWHNKLSDCVFKASDVFVREELVEAFASDSLLLTRLEQNDMAETSNENRVNQTSVVAEASKQCDADYTALLTKDNALVDRYNGLVHDYNDLLDRARRLANAPPIFLSMPMHQSIHCQGMNIGNMSTMDCD